MLRLWPQRPYLVMLRGGVRTLRPEAVWVDDEHWCCRRHVPPSVYSHIVEACHYSTCGSVRPSPRLPLCAHDPCTHPSRPRSKYCSDRCRVGNAHRRELERRYLSTEIDLTPIFQKR